MLRRTESITARVGAPRLVKVQLVARSRSDIDPPFLTTSRGYERCCWDAHAVTPGPVRHRRHDPACYRGGAERRGRAAGVVRRTVRGARRSVAGDVRGGAGDAERTGADRGSARVRGRHDPGA